MGATVRSILLLLLAVTAGWGQLVGQNVNMVSGTNWPLGDPFLQRQNEPSLAVSSRNSQHLLAGANDYRTVDLPGISQDVGEEGNRDAWLGLFQSYDGGKTWISWLLPGYPQDGTPEGAASRSSVFVPQGSGLVCCTTASDPVVRAGPNGMFYYAGIVFNRTPAANANFGVGAVIVGRFVDSNQTENIQFPSLAPGLPGSPPNPEPFLYNNPIQYLGTSAVGYGTANVFLDKPWIAVDIPRVGAVSPMLAPAQCSVNSPNVPQQSFLSGNIYVSYTAFSPDEDHGRIMFSRSKDCGATWSAPLALDLPLTSGPNSGFGAGNQGSQISIDPNTGRVYVIWRQVGSMADGTVDALFVVHSDDGGVTFSAPAPIISSLSNPPFSPFDQAGDDGTVKLADGTVQLEFRTEALPTAAVDGSGRVYVAWSERGAGADANGTPNGDARILLTSSTDGQAWTSPEVVDTSASNGLSQGRGHQIMPAMTFAGGQLMVLYYDLREDSSIGVFTPALVGGQPTGGLIETRQPVGALLNAPPPADSTVFNSYISDQPPRPLRHSMGVWVAQAVPGAAPAFSSTRVSSFDFGSPNDTTSVDGFQVSPTTIVQLQANVPDLPLFSGGTTPFMGDYLDIAAEMFTHDSNGNWIFNTASSNDTVFHTAWTDNRDVVPPSDGNWVAYTPVSSSSLGAVSLFDGTTPTTVCTPATQDKAGMRNQNIYSAAITQGIATNSPGNSKPLTTQFPRAFVVNVENTTSVSKSFRLNIGNQPPGGRATFMQNGSLLRVDVIVPPRSSIARSVFVTSTNAEAQVRVLVQEIAAPNGAVVANGLQSTVLLNADPSNPPNPNIGNAEIYNPNIGNPNIGNPNIGNPNIGNPNIGNPNIGNPNIGNSGLPIVTILTPNIGNPNIGNPNIGNAEVANPNIGNPNIGNAAVPDSSLANGAITDASWTVTNNGNTSMAYTIKALVTAGVPLNAGGSLAQGGPAQLVIEKIYATPAASGCSIGLQVHSSVLANITNPVFEQVGNNDAANPNIGNSAPSDATVSLMPGDTVRLTLRFVNPPSGFNPANSVITTATSHGADTNQLQAGNAQPPVGASALIVLTTSLPAGIIGAAYTQTLSFAGGTSPVTWSFTGSLPNGLTLNPATGVISGTPMQTGTFPISVTATDAAAHITVPQLLSLVINAPPHLAITSPPTLSAGTAGLNYSYTLGAIGGEGTRTWSVTGGALPPGLSLSSNVISGNPSASGAYSFTIQVTDQSVPTPQIASKAFSLTVAALAAGAQITFAVQPTNANVGQAINPPVQVTARTSAGAVIPGLQVTIAIGANPGGGALSGALTAVTNATGIASFNNLSVNLVGAGYTLVASALGVPSATSAPFTISLTTGDITTVVGSQWVFPGNGPAINAPIGPSFGVATDAAGVVYVADFGNNLVYSITPPGNLTVIAGTGVPGYSGDGGLATSAQLNAPAGIWVDAAENVYIAEFFGSRIRKVTPTGIISTVAGNGTLGYSGDNGPATSAALNAPIAVVTDAAGNLYIADRSNHRIRKVDTSGTITTIAGNGNTVFNGDGPATTVSLSFPWGISLDASGDLYIADSGHNRIRKLSGGNLTTVAGSAQVGFTPDGSPALNKPLANINTGLLVDSSGNIYYSENSRLRMINTGGILSTIAGTGGAGFSGDNGPAVDAAISFGGGISLDPFGNLYFADTNNIRVRKIDTSGTISTFAGNGQFKFGGDNGPATSAFLDSPQGIAFDSTGTLYIADQQNDRIRAVSTGGIITTVAGNGIASFSGNGAPAVNASLYRPVAVATGPTGPTPLYISDQSDGRVRVVNSSGTIAAYAGNGSAFGGDGGPATAAGLLQQSGVLADAAGNLFIADSSNHRVRKVDPAGIITTIAGNGNPGFSGDGGPATAAQLNGPRFLALDSAGNLYISDGNNNRVRMVSPAGIITTVAGNGTPGFSGDGPALTVSLFDPAGLATDAAGNLYIADQVNNRVRKLDTAGNLITVAGNGTTGFSGDGGSALQASFNSPIGLAFDGSGNLLISDSANDRIRRVLNVASAAGSPRLTITTASVPSTSTGAVYNAPLSAVGGSGTRTWTVVSGTLPSGVTLDSSTGLLSGTVGGAGIFTFRVQVTDSGQTAYASYTLLSNLVAGSSMAFISQPGAAAAGASLNPAPQVQVMGPGNSFAIGAPVTIAFGNNPGGAVLGGTLTQVTGANGIATFPNLTVSRGDNGYTLIASVVSLSTTSQAFNVTTAAGDIITLAGTNWRFSGAPGLATSVPIAPDHGVVIDSAGDVIASDRFNHQIVKITPAGALSVIAGTGVAGFSGDGGPATSAQFGYPEGLALDGAGNLYVADDNFVRKIDTQGIVTTFAGIGPYGFSGDGGPAVDATFRTASSVAVDTAGNVYVVDQGNHRVRKITPAGIISTVAGNGTAGFSGDNGPATSAMLNNPESVVVDSAGNLFIADQANHRIRKVTPGGIISTVAGSGVCCTLGDGGQAVNAWIDWPAAVSLDSAGDLFLSEQYGARVREVTPAGIISTVVGTGFDGFSGDSGPAVSAQIDEVTGLAFDSAGDLYLVDSINRRIREVNTSKYINTIAGNGLFKFNGDGPAATNQLLNSPQGVTVDVAGNVYVADSGNLRIRKISPSGALSTIAGNGIAGFSGDGGPSTAAQISDFTTDLRMDPSGNLLIADHDNGTVRKITPGGTISTLASGLNPYGIAVDAAGNLYVAEDGNNDVIKIDSVGNRTTLVGASRTPGFSGDGGPAAAAQLFNPVGVAVDSAGNVYISDSGNSRIRRVTPGGMITTLAGNGTTGYSGDGGLATSASLSGDYCLNGMQVDLAGNLYVADSCNERIRKIDVTGIITTVAGTGQYGYTGDGGPATNAGLASPRNLEVDAAGNLFIADAGNDRIREVLAPGPPPTPGSRLTITTTALSAASTSAGYNQSLATTGGNGALTFSVTSGALPPGLNLNPATGAIAGTPTTIGTYSFTITVVDSGSPQQSTAQPYTVTVGP